MSNPLIRLGLAACVVSMGLVGCREDMQNQPKYRPYKVNTFFKDSMAMREHVQGTVARGQLREDEGLFTGKQGGELVAEVPFAVTQKVLDRGEERFNIYCTPCHGKTGYGDGMVVRRGYRTPPSFHQDRLRTAPMGHFFDVMTNGFGVMPDYASQVPTHDRWAIAAYIRALQLSQHASAADVPQGTTMGAAATPKPTGSH